MEELWARADDDDFRPPTGWAAGMKRTEPGFFLRGVLLYREGAWKDYPTDGTQAFQKYPGLLLIP